MIHSATFQHYSCRRLFTHYKCSNYRGFFRRVRAGFFFYFRQLPSIRSRIFALANGMQIRIERRNKMRRENRILAPSAFLFFVPYRRYEIITQA